MAHSTSPIEMGLTVAVLAATTAIATKMFVLSNAVTSSPVTAVILVVIALGLFNVYPAVGVSLLLLTAVLMFNRNVRNTIKLAAHPTGDNFQNTSNDTRLSDDVFQHQMNGPNPPDRTATNVAPSNQALLDTMDADRPSIPMPSGPAQPPPAYRGVYGADSIMGENVGVAVGAPEGGIRSAPRPYDEFKETDPSNPLLGPVKAVEGFEPATFGAEQGDVPDGGFPIGEQRAMSSGEKRDYVYRPDESTGTNDFQRFGPNLDEKTDSFKYYTD
jgi:hypothetical protein